jgi:hypothetical protein
VAEWQNVGPRLRLTDEALSALSVGTVRTFDCGGVLVAMEKRADGFWQVRPRRVPPFLLIGLRSHERVKVQDEEPCT